ncbi:unnamed protein product [Urochloa humidicola]
MASSRKLLFLLLAVVAAAFLHVTAAARGLQPPPAPAPAHKYCGDTLAGLKACGSFVFGGASKPSPACCAAFDAVYTSGESLCLCYLEDDGTFWRAVGAGDANAAAAAAESPKIPYKCGHASWPAIEFRCDETAPDDIPPFGPQGTPPAQPPAISGGAAGAPTARPPSDSGPKEIPPPYVPQGTLLAIFAGAGGAPAAQPPSAHSVDGGILTGRAYNRFVDGGEEEDEASVAAKKAGYVAIADDPEAGNNN